VRFIAATHRDLRELVAERRFREDLFFRLDGVPIRVPPLRERVAEIVPLAERLLVDAARAAGKHAMSLSEDAAQRLRAHAWPGNVRELRTVIQRSVLFCTDAVLSAHHLRFDDAAPPSDPALPAPAPSQRAPEDAHERARVERRKRVVEALEATQWNQRKAAERLGVSRRTLQTWMIGLAIPRPRAKS
jgi:DNA-binding NtrC family response regulator